MTYSYTQISQYLTCPRRYRHRYLDGWKEKDTRAAMLFGRAFERALGALFRREDPGAVLFAEWSACQSQDLALFQQRLLGSHASARNHAPDPVLPGRSRPGSPASTKSANQVHAASSATRTTSSPISMLSGSSMASAACWSGKRLRADTRMSLKDCCLSIRNWSAIRG